MAGHQLVQLALRPNFVNVMESLLQGGVGVQEITIPGGSSVVGRTLQEAGLLKPGGAHLLALSRASGELHVNPPAELRLERDDVLIVLGSEQQLQATALLLQ
jgi:Trk K+ transport system NAD-binding subunit